MSFHNIMMSKQAIALLLCSLPMGAAGFISPFPRTAHRTLHAWQNTEAWTRINDRESKSALASKPPNDKTRTSDFALYSTESEREELLRKAQQLRQNAEELEQQMAPQRLKQMQSRELADQAKKEGLQPAVYTSLDDSIWQVTFRIKNKFQDQDQDDDDNKSEEKMDTNKSDDSTNSKAAVAVTGKVLVRLQPDGYTTQISMPTTGNDGEKTNAAIRSTPDYFAKIWGWDQEVSQEEDQETYVMWSADISPTSEDIKRAGFADPSTRLYFQARVDGIDSQSGELSLKDGKVTIKQAVEAGFWGVFNGVGILAEFKDIGDFSCRPVQII
jgi:hypothetical protein